MVNIHIDNFCFYLFFFYFYFEFFQSPQPKYTENDIEEQLQINHLGHFLLCSLLLPDMQKAKDPRMIIVGSITGKCAVNISL